MRIVKHVAQLVVGDSMALDATGSLIEAEVDAAVDPGVIDMRRAAYERQGGICPVCKKHYEIEGMEADHITPWSKGGRTSAENCQMLCLEDNRRKRGLTHPRRRRRRRRLAPLPGTVTAAPAPWLPAEN